MNAATAAISPATTVGFSNKLEYHRKWRAKSSDRDDIWRAAARARVVSPFTCSSSSSSDNGKDPNKNQRKKNTTVLVVGATRRVGRIVFRKLMLRGHTVKDYNNKLAQFRARKSSKSKLLIAKLRTADSLSGWEVHQGRYFQDVVCFWHCRPSSVMSSSHPFSCRFKHLHSSAICVRGFYSKPSLGRGAVRGLPEPSPNGHNCEDDRKHRQYTADIDQHSGVTAIIDEVIPGDNKAIVSACIIGLLTGISVVLFNVSVHGIRDFCWDGIAYRGASWLREERLELIWARVILVPACGGLVVSTLNLIISSLEGPLKGILIPSVSSALEPILKALAACVTLGTGNSLGPEGPSVEIGASVAKGVGFLFDKGGRRKLSLGASGSAAGISSGFNAAVAGCFFAVESVLWPSPPESSLSLTNTTSMVILSAVIASVVSEIGLGSEPAFSIPEYDFRSPSELPLYLLLGILCGLVSVTLSRCTSFMLESVTNVEKSLGVPKVAFPVVGGLVVGLLALAYPEILYWGFENVDILLESRPFVKGLSVDLLLQLVAIKIVATSLCRASGLVGGYYAPSLFIGAATGMAYGKVVGLLISQSNSIFHLSILEVASPQAYGLVGMAATLAGVCQVPLTAVLLLFELTQDYRIVLPLLGAVGMSSWITSGQARRRAAEETKQLKDENAFKVSDSDLNLPSFMFPEKTLNERNLCELESSLCLYDPDFDTTNLAKEIVISQAMRTKYVTVRMRTLLREAVSLMFAEKQPCAVIVDDDGLLIGMLTLNDVQLFSRSSLYKTRRPEDMTVSKVCTSIGTNCQMSWTVTPNMSLYYAQTIMDRYGISELPVVSEDVKNRRSQPIGLLDRECIRLACRMLFLTSTLEDSR